MTSAAVDAWIAHLAGISAEPPIAEGNTLRVNIDPTRVSAGQPLNLGEGLEEFRLELVGAFQAQTHFVFVEPVPREVAIHIPAQVKQLTFTIPTPIPRLELDIENRDSADLVATGQSAWVLAIKGGAIDLRGDAFPEHLEVEDTSISTSQSMRTIVLDGRVLTTGTMYVGKAFTRGTPALGGTEWRIGDLVSLDGKSCSLRVEGGVVMAGWVEDQAELWCASRLVLGNLNDRKAIVSVTLHGPGRIEAPGLLERPVFVPGDPTIELAVQGQVLDASGEIDLEGQSRAVVSGGPKGALVLKKVLGVSGAEVEYVNIYGLTIGDLAPLSETERFYPWMPRGRECRRREDGMFTTSEDSLARRQRMHFWLMMSELVKKRGAPGRVQSESRYAAQRARRRALQRTNRERWLLGAYKFVGYGERITWPLGWYLVSSLALAHWFAAPPQGYLHLRETGQMWRRVAEAPLSFFRLQDSDVLMASELMSTWQRTSLLGFRVIGLLLLVLSVVAMRRLVRLE